MIIPDDVYNRLIEETKSNRVKRSLTAINTVCKEQRERGSSDFSVSTISKLGENSGVPHAQSIRNKTGKMYYDLIKSWQVSNPNVTKTVTTKREWVDRINDATTRFLVQDLLVELTKVNSEVNLLKSIKKLNIDMRTEAKCLTEIKSQQPSVNLTPSEIEALKYAVNEKQLANRGWSIGERGKIVDQNNNNISMNGYVDAISKILLVNNNG